MMIEKRRMAKPESQKWVLLNFMFLLDELVSICLYFGPRNEFWVEGGDDAWSSD